MSSESWTNLLTLTPSAGKISNRVIIGPVFIAPDEPSTPKFEREFLSSSDLSLISSSFISLDSSDDSKISVEGNFHSTFKIDLFLWSSISASFSMIAFSIEMGSNSSFWSIFWSSSTLGLSAIISISVCWTGSVKVSFSITWFKDSMLSSALMFSRNESSSIILTFSFLSFTFLKSGIIFLKSNSTLEILLIKTLGTSFKDLYKSILKNDTKNKAIEEKRIKTEP